MASRNPWLGLLFLQGHIADPGLARALSTARGAGPGTAARGAPGLLGHVRYPGGRPVHAGHNVDVEEPPGDQAPAAAPATRGAVCAGQPLAC